MQEGIFAHFKTEKGDIKIQLTFDKTPGTVGNFVGLVEGAIENKVSSKGTPYYDGLKFHRVIADFYLFDQDLKLVYRGRFDDARPKNDNPVTGKDLINACQKLSKGAAQETDQIPSLGCNIKWKAGNEPKGFSI